MDDMDDGRPMVTDVFLAKLIESDCDAYDVVEAVKCWCYGSWCDAMYYIEGDE